MKSYKLICCVVLFYLMSCTSKIDFTNDTAPPVPPAVSDLLISEITTFINTDAAAGGVRNHYVELFNGTNVTVDLANYAIGYNAVSDISTLSPWDFSSSSNYFILQGSLNANKCYVIASPQCNTTAVKRDTVWGTTSTASADASKPLQLSGNSGIALLKKDAAGTYTLNGVKYKIIDVFGSPLVARVMFTGSSSSRNNIFWTIAGEVNDTRNRTFFRKSTVKNPTIDWALSKGTTATDSQWEITADRVWDYTNLGLPSR